MNGTLGDDLIFKNNSSWITSFFASGCHFIKSPRIAISPRYDKL